MNEMEGQMTLFDQDIWCGKMSPEPSVVTKEKTSELSLKNSPKSKTKMPLFLCLTKENGQTVDASWETDGASLGEFSMHSFGEFPKDVAESHLSQILEDNPLPKYSLSAKACQGILNRANRRGKSLPPMLQDALEQMIDLEQTNTMQDREGCAGGGKGALIQTDRSAALRTVNSQYLFAPVYSVENHPNDSRVGINEDGMVQALTGRMGTGGGNVPLVMESKSNFIDVEMEVAVRKYEVNKDLLQECLRDHKGSFTNKEIAEALGKPLTLVEHWFRRDSSFAIPDADTWFELKELLGIETSGFDQSIMTFEYKGGNYDMRNRIHTGSTAPTLTCGSGNSLHLVPMVLALDREAYNSGQNFARTPGIYEDDIAPTMVSRGQVTGTLTANNAGGNQRMPDKENFNCVITNQKTRYIVRRLTPLECERLQGYPDGWTDIGDWTDSNGKVHKASDAARYKALGNSIALPPWKWVLKRLCACYERDATMASLFDGIGGFPYLWEQLNGKGSCLWASEIEEFPIAVTKVRIGK